MTQNAKRYLCACVAIALHFLILLTPLSGANTITHKASKERTLVVELKDDHEELSLQTITDKQPTANEVEVEVENQNAKNTLNDNVSNQASTEELRILVSPLKIEQWAKQESSKYLDQRDKTNISKLRRGSYTEKWLDPNRIDTRDSDKDTVIRTPDGVIHVSKVNGELICILLERDGGMRSFYCGDPILNILQNKSGSIKNSDREQWKFSD